MLLEEKHNGLHPKIALSNLMSLARHRIVESQLLVTS